jgi:16S rRNA pseudouridine516 synthase
MRCRSMHVVVRSAACKLGSTRSERTGPAPAPRGGVKLQRNATLGVMRIADLLFTQGFGSRRECLGLVASGQVQLQGRPVTDPLQEVVEVGLEFVVNGQRWLYQAEAVLMLHKPAGFECSRAPRDHPSVLSLLPAPLRQRGVQPVGRLDQDTTGLLLLTDNGALIHRLTHPKRHVAKVYVAQTRHAVDERQIAALLQGVVLHDAPAAVRALACKALAPTVLQLTISEGRYHQVKRMVAAAGNRVEQLHRVSLGPLTLPEGLAQGEWRWLSAKEQQALSDGTALQVAPD